MKTKIFLVAMVAVLAVGGILGAFLVSSGTKGVSAQTEPVNVNVASQQQGIWVSGQGKVTVTPDIATLSVGVSAQAATVVDAQSQAATAMDKVVSALTSNGIAKTDIQTQNFNVQALTKYDNNTQQTTITGYKVSNTVTVKIREIDKAGTIIDAAVAAGGDFTRINGLTFSVDNPEQYYPQARKLAMSDAQDKAQQLASLAGVTLGRATYINENTSNPVVPYPIYGVSEAAQAPTPTTSISPGQTDIIVNVQVAYAIQ